MLKRFVSSLLVVTLLCGCSSAPKEEAPAAEATIDVKAEGARLVETLNLGDIVTDIDEKTASAMIGFDEHVLEQSVYVSKLSTADLVIVVRTDDMASTKDTITRYHQDLRAQMENYFPEEVGKMDKYVAKEQGDIYYYIICDDADAAYNALN